MSVEIDIDDRSTEIEEMEEIREVANCKEMSVKIDIDDRSTEIEEMEETRGVKNRKYGKLKTNHGMTETKGKEMTQTNYVMKMLGELPDEFVPRNTIFRLPNHEMKEKLCEPKVVSIGPYHRGKPGLQTMEHQKWFTLRGFLARNKNVDVEFYLQEMKIIEAKARQCYSEPVNYLGSDEFVLMLLLDGCFILEWLSTIWDVDYSIFSTGWNIVDIFDDLLLMENQLPFFVLHNLFAIGNQGMDWHPYCISQPCPFLDLVIGADSVNLFNNIEFGPIECECDNIGHYLHLYYQRVDTEITRQHPPETPSEGGRTAGCLIGFQLFSRSNKPAVSFYIGKNNQKRHVQKEIQLMCVSELCAAGVKFKKKKNPNHILDISFANGTIEMPFLKIDSHFVRLLWNMVAHEQRDIGECLESPFSSYLALMDSLIDTEKDVEILERAGIVDNYFSNAEEAAVFFNQFGKLFFLEYKQHYFSDLFRDVKKYSESTWPRYRARLVQDYFSNPWTIISVLAAMALFALTILQTYYSGISV